MPPITNTSNIGSDKAIQDPQDAIRRETGDYHDKACDIPESEKLPMGAVPMAPEKTPFRNVTKAGGAR